MAWTLQCSISDEWLHFENSFSRLSMLEHLWLSAKIACVYVCGSSIIPGLVSRVIIRHVLSLVTTSTTTTTTANQFSVYRIMDSEDTPMSFTQQGWNQVDSCLDWPDSLTQCSEALRVKTECNFESFTPMNMSSISLVLISVAFLAECKILPLNPKYPLPVSGFCQP